MYGSLACDAVKVHQALYHLRLFTYRFFYLLAFTIFDYEIFDLFLALWTFVLRIDDPFLYAGLTISVSAAV